MEFAKDSFELGNIWREEKTEGILEGKIEELKKEKRTLKTSITKLRNEMAVWNYRRKRQTRKISRKNKTSTSDGTNYWSCWTPFNFVRRK